MSSWRILGEGRFSYFWILEMPLNNIGEAFGFSTFSTGSSKDHRSESSNNCIFILTELLNAALGQVGYGVSNLGLPKVDF